MFPFRRFRVEDDSMRPALAPGDYVLVNRWAYRFREPRKGEVVVLRCPEAPGFLVKRIADTLGPEAIYVLGDNPERSRDSRHFGPVPRGALVGKVWLRVNP